MSRYEPQWFGSPLKLPERKSGPAEIRHRYIPVGEEVRIVGMRQAFCRGTTPVSGRVANEPLRITELVHEEHGVWMSDLPEELNQIGELIYTVRPRGSVLVGGLGLGLLASAVAQRASVKRVLVVERDPHVIELCADRKLYSVVERDIAEHLREAEAAHDFYLLDTWQGTNEGTWWRRVMPLRRIIRNRWGSGPTVHCWAEDIMQGQVFRSLTSKPPHWYYAGLPMPMSARDARSFLRNVGSVAWERAYGTAIDRAAKAEEPEEAEEA